MKWRKADSEDGTVFIFGGFKVASLEEASAKASQAVKIIKSHREDNHSHMSISSEGLVIALHGVTKEKIDDDDWTIAKE